MGLSGCDEEPCPKETWRGNGLFQLTPPSHCSALRQFRAGTHSRNLGSPTSITNQMNVSEASPQANLVGAFSQLKFCLPKWLWLLSTWHKSSQHSVSWNMSCICNLNIPKCKFQIKIKQNLKGKPWISSILFQFNLDVVDVKFLELDFRLLAKKLPWNGCNSASAYD